MPGAQIISTPLVNQITASCLDRCSAAVAIAAVAAAALAAIAAVAAVQERAGTAVVAVARIALGLACGSETSSKIRSLESCAARRLAWRQRQC